VFVDIVRSTSTGAVRSSTRGAVDDVRVAAGRRVSRVGFQLDPRADLDAVVQGHGTVEVNFTVGMLVETSALAVNGIKRVIIGADTENLFGGAADRQLRLVCKRRTGNGENTGSDQSGRRQ